MELIQPLASSAVRFMAAKPNQVFAPDLIRAAQERYRFWRVPQSLEEYSQAEGAQFQTGIFEGVVIDSLKLFNNGIVAEGRARTESLDSALDDITDWASREFGLEYEYLQPVARSYTSTIEVRSKAPLSKHITALNAAANRLTEMVAAYGFTVAPYEFTALIAATEPELATPIKPGRFLFDRRAGKPFSSDIYFSEAPVATAEHLELLGLLEAIFATS